MTQYEKQELLNQYYGEQMTLKAALASKDYQTIREAEGGEPMKDITKKANAKPTLIPTGMKCKLEEGTYLELSVRSSCPLKHWIMMANSVGIIDKDYYNNEDNEGHIFFQVVNMSPLPIIIKKGEAIGQAIIHKFDTVEDDAATGIRTSGFGSTDAASQPVLQSAT